MQKRTEKIRKMMKNNKIDFIIVSEEASIKYLTYETIDAGERFTVFVISRNDSFWIRNKLFPLKKHTFKDISYLDGSDYIKLLSDKIPENSKIGIDKFLYSKFLLELLSRRKDLTFVNGSEIVDEVRSIKDENEIIKMRKSSHLNDLAIKELVKHLKVGVTEKEAAYKLSEIYKKLGADGFSFPPIVAFGESSANPHHEVTDKKLTENTIVLIDIGCMKDGYASDMTRTYFFGTPTDEMKKVHNIVKEANEKATKVIKEGIKLSDIDKIARTHISNSGYGKNFTHRLGHFIGLTTHETGEVSPTSEIIAKEGMIFSIEPGIYIPEKFGVRIENLVAVTKNGCEILNKVSHNPYISL